MLREFTKAVGNFGKGVHCDYPQSTWDHIARSAEMELDVFTKAVVGVSRAVPPAAKPTRRQEHIV